MVQNLKFIARYITKIKKSMCYLETEVTTMKLKNSYLKLTQKPELCKLKLIQNL